MKLHQLIEASQCSKGPKQRYRTKKDKNKNHVEDDIENMDTWDKCEENEKPD